MVAGHSLGEYSAHVAAGTLTFADAVRLVRNRGRYMQEAVPVGTGAMAAILGLEPAGVAQACAEAAQGEVVSPANLNAPGQIVIAGSTRRRAARHRTCEGAGRAPGDSAAGQRAVSLRADEAGRRAADAGAACGSLRTTRACRSLPTSMRQPKTDAQSCHRRADPAGLVAGPLGRRRCAAWWRMA